MAATLGILFTLEFFTFFERRIRTTRFRYMRLEVTIKKEARVQEVRRVLRNLKIQFSNEETRNVLGETHYIATLYYKGELEKMIEDELMLVSGVRDVNFLGEGMDT
jgi:uncharacterized membrane protein YhiD involved in acid resistance